MTRRPQRRGHGSWRRLLAPARLLFAVQLALMWTIGFSLNAIPSSAAFLSSTQTVGGNTIGAAAQFSPTGLTATQAAGPSAVLSWNAPAGGWAASYQIFRSAASGGPYTMLTSGGCAAPVVAISCTDGTVSSGAHYYLVRGVSSRGGLGDPSGEVALTVDTTSPALHSSSPANTAASVPLDAAIVLTFSEKMNTAAAEGAFSASPAVICAWTWNSPANTVATCTPSADLTQDTLYTVTVGTGAQDLAGNGLAPAASFSFRTFATAGAPAVNAITPFNGASGVGTNTTVAVTFSQTMNQSSAEAAFSLQQTTGTGSPCLVYPTGAGACASAGGAFSWTANNTMVFTPAADLAASAAFMVTVSTAAQNSAGTAMGAGLASAFTTGAARDTTAPQVIPPTTPAAGQTGVGVNARVIITFSEGMDNAATQTAISLKPCSDNVLACTSQNGPLTGSYIWGGAGGNILSFEPSSALAPNQWHQAAVATVARDLAGNAMTSPYSFVFQTGAGSAAAPGAPAVTTPLERTWTASTSASISGTAEADALVQIWSDGGARGAIDGTDTLIASLQLAGGLTTWTIAVPLTLNADNLFQATATNSVGVRSAPAVVPVITQGEARTVAGTLTLSPGSDSITVTANFTGDANGNNSALVEYRTPPGVGAFTSGGAMNRSAGAFSKLIPGLTRSSDYDVRVTFTDGDGTVGANPLTAAATTLAGSQTGLVGSQVASNLTLASRAGQTTVISVNLGAGTSSSRVVIGASPAKNLPCNHTNGPAAVTFTWDGTDGSNNPVADGSYGYTVVGYTNNTCNDSNSSARQEAGGTVIVSNVRTLAMEPAPATVFLTPGQSTVVTATLVNRRDELVRDGVTVNWTAAGSYSGAMNGALSRAASVVGTSYPGECAVTAQTGQACVKLTIPAGSKIVQTVTVTATLNSQLTGTTQTAVSGATTILDPPLDAPDDLVIELAPSSAIRIMAAGEQRRAVRLSWRAARHPKVVGYLVSLGSSPTQLTREIRVEEANSVDVADLEPGAAYYARLRSFDQIGQLSPPSRTFQFTAPGATSTATATASPTASATASASATVSATATATATATASATPTASASPSASPTASAGSGGSATATVTATATPSPTATVSSGSGSGGSGSGSGAATATATPTETATATATTTPTETATATATTTPTETATATATTTPTETATATPTGTGSGSGSGTATATVTATPTGSATATATATATGSATATATAPATPTGSATATATATTTGSPTATATGTASASPTATATATGTATVTASPTASATGSATATSTATSSPTATVTPTATATRAATASPTVTATATATPTATAARTATATATAAAAPSASGGTGGATTGSNSQPNSNTSSTGGTSGSPSSGGNSGGGVTGGSSRRVDLSEGDGSSNDAAGDGPAGGAG